MAEETTKKTGSTILRVRRLISLMNENHLSELELEEQDFRIRLVKSVAVPQFRTVPALDIQLPEHSGGTTAKPSEDAAAKAKDEANGFVPIKSPIVGTFYRAPAPDAKVYIQNGSHVEAETVVCIVEAMKVMNELKAECRGTITKICVENGQTVEYGQVLFLVKPD
ncbi:MAG: acetyl-CoA carboxylase biotin carboxyl carrier protein [Candidatus Brocadiia bacterium]